MVVEEHDHHFVVDFKSCSSIVRVWSDTSIDDDIEGTEQYQSHELDKWIVIPDGWDGYETDSPEQ